VTNVILKMFALFAKMVIIGGVNKVYVNLR
jgi:hypothetical protein